MCAGAHGRGGAAGGVDVPFAHARLTTTITSTHGSGLTAGNNVPCGLYEVQDGWTGPYGPMYVYRDAFENRVHRGVWDGGDEAEGWRDVDKFTVNLVR
jgi:hypothetical protein